MLREGSLVFVRAFSSEGKGHEHGRKVHRRVSDDEWGKPSCTQVDRHINEHGKKAEAPIENEPPVGYERNKNYAAKSTRLTRQQGIQPYRERATRRGAR